MSVSNVINGRKVKEKTRTAVLHAIEMLNYRPNPAARQLASSSNISIGLLYHDVERPFIGTLLVNALASATRLGVQILLHHVDFDDVAASWEAVDILRSRGAKALLLPPVFCEAMARRRKISQIDMPLIGISPGKELATMSSMRIDDFAASRDMTTMLIEKGHRRIGFIRAPQTLAIHETRCGGYLEALRLHGIAADPGLIVDGGLTYQSALGSAAALLNLKRRPTAIFASNDDMAAGALMTAHMRGLTVPNDLAIAGFDDTSLAKKVWPPLTTVRQPVDSMVNLAMDKLVQQVRDNVDTKSMPKSTTYFNYTIVRRASTGD